MTPSPPGPAPREGCDDPADDWTVELDAAPGVLSDSVDRPDRGEPRLRASLRGWTAAALAIAAVAASIAIWGPEVDTGEDPPPVAAVLGGHLAVPIALHLPQEAVATADGSYVGVQFPAGGAVLVTVPTQVVDPASGLRVPMPADPAAWVGRHPEVFVSRVRPVTVGGVAATQLDYRRSRMNAPPSRFARLSLFCGWRTDSGPVTVCTQITAEARVRATFVPVGGRVLLVEAVWPADAATGTGRMPKDLQRSYSALLRGLTPKIT